MNIHKYIKRGLHGEKSVLIFQRSRLMSARARMSLPLLARSMVVIVVVDQYLWEGFELFLAKAI
jgi:hypothetical protein